MTQGELFQARRADDSLRFVSLPDESEFFTSRLPQDLIPDAAGFAELWALHPEHYHEIRMHGRSVKTPRFQQAYGADYHYTGRVNRALPVPPELAPFLAWGKSRVDERLNGVLLNWYEGTLGHYIGKHRDSTIGMVEASPIVTISLGQERTFRLRPWKDGRKESKQDFLADEGSVFVIPYETNLRWTHEVPARRRLQGRRISITLRAFEGRSET